MHIPYVIDNLEICLADVLNDLFQREQGQQVDIGRAYFSIRGFELLRNALPGVRHFRLLLGDKPLEGEDIGLRPDSAAYLRHELNAELLTEGTLQLVEELIRFLCRDNGVIVADSVGLGKTWIGKKLLEDYAYHLRHKALVICPASLRPMWENELRSAVISAYVITQERLAVDDFGARERALEELLGLVRSPTAKIEVINQTGFLDASVPGEVVTPRDFNTLKRIADEDNSVIEEQEFFLELASSEVMLAITLCR
jgi:hypothetical protein